MRQFLTLCVGVLSIANAFSTKQRDSTIEIFRKRNFIISEEQQATDHAEDFCEEIGENGIFEDPQNCSSVFFCGGDGMYADQLHCEEGTVFHPRLVECTHPYCLPQDDECYEPCNEPGCEDWDEDDYYQHCGLPQRGPYDLQ